MKKQTAVKKKEEKVIYVSPAGFVNYALKKDCAIRDNDGSFVWLYNKEDKDLKYFVKNSGAMPLRQAQDACQKLGISCMSRKDWEAAEP